MHLRIVTSRVWTFWIHAAAFALAIVGVDAVAAKPASLALVSTAWPPFTNAAGQPRFALDLVETALGRIGLLANTAIVSPAQFTPSLLAELFDGSAAVWKDAERERVLIFSQPYLENRLVLIGRHGADVSAKALSEIRGKRVAIVEGYSYGESVEHTGPLFVHSKNEEDSLSKLLAGTVDYTLMDELVVQYIVSNYPKESEAKLRIGTTPMFTRPLHFALRRTRPDAASVIERFNAQLQGMIADRTYHRLLHVNWIRADVNGDGVPEYVPATDTTGPTEPKRAYALFSDPTAGSRSPTKPGFYVDGKVYNDWASVPDSYKASSKRDPDPRVPTNVFAFSW